MSPPNWDELDLEPLAEELRETLPPPEQAKMMWAFEEALRVARIDDHLLEHVLVATVCLLARARGTTPREVLEVFFRRSVTDDEWRQRYAALFA
jgi:hypothetical protein